MLKITHAQNHVKSIRSHAESMQTLSKLIYKPYVHDYARPKPHKCHSKGGYTNPFQSLPSWFTNLVLKIPHAPNHVKAFQNKNRLYSNAIQVVLETRIQDYAARAQDYARLKPRQVNSKAA